MPTGPLDLLLPRRKNETPADGSFCVLLTCHGIITFNCFSIVASVAILVLSLRLVLRGFVVAQRREGFL